jgi:hypothetical protein
MTTPLSSHGTILSFQPTPGGAFSDVAELGDLTLPGFMRNVFDATVQNRTIDSKVLGVIRRKTFTFPVNYIPQETTHNETNGLLKLFKDNTITGFKVTFPDSPPTAWIMSGQVSGFDPKAPVDGKLAADVTLEFSGAMILGTTSIS